jgi:DNA-binding transcriptional LysR family regulator
VDLICELVEQGMGKAFLPDYATEAAVARGAVVRLDAEGFRPELWKQILYHREKWLTPAMEAVLELLTEK